MKTFCRLLLAFGILMTTTSGTFAQGTQVPSLITIPSIPVANQPFKLKPTFFGPTTPCFFENSAYVGSGQPGSILVGCDVEAPR